jgi:hypothetical protein
MHPFTIRTHPLLTPVTTPGVPIYSLASVYVKRFSILSTCVNNPGSGRASLHPPAHHIGQVFLMREIDVLNKFISDLVVTHFKKTLFLRSIRPLVRLFILSRSSSWAAGSDGIVPDTLAPLGQVRNRSWDGDRGMCHRDLQTRDVGALDSPTLD